MRGEAAHLAALLAARMPALVAVLLPGGVREGHEWRCGSLLGERGRSLAVRLAGERVGVWCDFATGEAGDALDLVAQARCSGDRGEAVRWARAWLGEESPRKAATARATPAVSTAPADAPVATGTPAGAPGTALAGDRADDDRARRRRAAVALFLSAGEGIAGTPVAAYLAGRGIELAELGRAPRCLRFHPEVFCREAGAALPAMLAAITDAEGQHVATHRTWLAPNGTGGWRKAMLRDPKMTLGSYAGGAVRLWRGASRRPLHEAPPGETVAIAEGIETALSVAVACPELRVLAAVSLANMGRVLLPASVGVVILCADNDAAPGARAALERAAVRLVAEARAVRIARSPIGKDFNDVLRADQEVPAA
jgi:hypothetical protein